MNRIRHSKAKRHRRFRSRVRFRRCRPALSGERQRHEDAVRIVEVVAERWTLGAGLGYQILDTKNIDWEVNGGASYQRTQFDDVLEGESERADTPALVIGTVYDQELSKAIDFLFDYRFFSFNLFILAK